jgi:hypothetical protein
VYSDSKVKLEANAFTLQAHLLTVSYCVSEYNDHRKQTLRPRSSASEPNPAVDIDSAFPQRERLRIERKV